MTLIFAGYCYERELTFGFGTTSVEGTDPPAKRKLEPGSDLYFACDTGISEASGRPILNSFLKVKTLPLKIWRPNFIDVYFDDYVQIFLESTVTIAFAGSTLFADLAFGFIQEHLGKLRVSYTKNDDPDSANTYKFIIRKHCDQENPFYRPGVTTYDLDFFTSYRAEGLYTPGEIAEFINHCMNGAIKQATKNHPDLSLFHARMQAEFAVGIYCPKSRKNLLYYYAMDFIENDGIINEVKMRYRLINPDELVVMGVRQYETQAKQVMLDAINNGEKVELKMFDFLNDCITQRNSEGKHDISRPSYLYIFESSRTHLERIRQQR